jgi:hypothetical protein
VAKQLSFGEDARRRLKVGTDIMSQAVKTTLGPKGRNVALDKKWGAPTVIHDGVTVAKDIELSDPFENMGAQLLKEAATKTNEVAGDSTTTATVLAQVWHGDRDAVLWECYMSEQARMENWQEELADFWQAVERDVGVERFFTQPHEPTFIEGYRKFLRRPGYAPDTTYDSWWSKHLE